MSFQQFKALTFDVVGTLIDFETGMLNYIRSVAGDAGKEISDEKILDVYRRLRTEDKAGLWPDDMERCYHVIAAELGLPDSEAIAKGLPLAVKDFPAFADSVEALKRLKRHFTLVANTNSRDWGLDFMEVTLDSPFDVRVTVDDVRFEKPDPQFFAYTRGVLATQGIGFDEILHVAQSQYHDIGVTRRLGYKNCWIERRHAKQGTGGTVYAEHTDPDFHYRSLAELADAVEKELG